MISRPFVAWVSEGKNVYLNLLQVRTVTLGQDGLVVSFSDTHHVNIHGDGAVDFLDRLGELAMALNGEPIAPIQRDIPRTASPEGQGQGA